MIIGILLIESHLDEMLRNDVLPAIQITVGDDINKIQLQQDVGSPHYNLRDLLITNF